MRQHAFDAVVADTDGVLTRTAELHERAWKRVFDAFLAHYEGQRSFSGADYRAHVDGKPRYDGVADFLASREIDIPIGDPSDSPDRESVCGLGNRKNATFLALLEQHGIEAFHDAVAALERWRRGGMKLAAISASRNCRRVLQRAGIAQHVDLIVDGQVASDLQLQGKREILVEAARQLDIDPADAVVLEDGVAGVRAARQGGFGLVAGVARHGHARELSDAGADLVVSNVFHLPFLRKVPNALERLDELSRWRDTRQLAVFVDYDGTLTPIVEDPRQAEMSPAMRDALAKLAERCPVAVISGRDRDDVARRVGIDGLTYAGNHGFDIAGPDRQKTLPAAEAASSVIASAGDELAQRLQQVPGVYIERKRFSVAVHVRRVKSASDVDRVEDTVARVAEETGLRKRTGKKVVELEPAVEWNKGRALRWVAEALPAVDAGHAWIAYLGDDETDEDAFAALEGEGPGIRVGPKLSTSLADYQLDTPDQVLTFLKELAAFGP